MYAAVLTVRLGSSRLPRKALLDLGGLSALEFSIHRCRHGGMSPFVFTSNDNSDDEIETLAESLSVPIFRGDLLNKVDRWHKGFEFFNLPDGHLVDVDDPYFDPEACKKSLDLLRANPSLKIVLPSLNSDSGAAYVGTSVTSDSLLLAVEKLNALGITDTDVVPWEKLIPSYQTTRSDSNSETPDLRLTLDYPEDFELLSILAKKFGPTSSRSELEAFMRGNRNLCEINLFRNDQFIANKLGHLKKIGALDA